MVTGKHTMKKQDLNQLVFTYKELLKNGNIQTAYSELIKYVQKLRTIFSKDLNDSYTFGGVFQGYMDYTYFYFSNDYLKNKKLKLGLVFNHSEVRFELWLLGQTKEIQEKYWASLKESKWIDNPKMPLYSVFEVILIDNPNFSDLKKLTDDIKNNLISIADDISISIQLLD